MWGTTAQEPRHIPVKLPQENAGSMTRLTKISVMVAVLALLLVACAPDDLDITPSPTPEPTPTQTNTPAPTSTPDPNAEAQAGADESEEAESGDLLDQIVSVIPGEIPAGPVNWMPDGDPEFEEVDGGRTVHLPYRERGGSLAELTFGVFESPDAAQTFYDAVAGRTRTLENAETRDNLPTPNLFGSGTYGSDAIFLQDNLYVRVSVPQFSSTLGEPLGPLSRQVFGFLEDNEFVAPSS